MEDLHTQLGDMPTDTPAVLLLGDGLALVGSLDMGAVSGVDHDGTALVDVGLVVPACSCIDPDTDVDPDCRRHYPATPAGLVERLLPAARAGTQYELGGPNSELAGVTTPEDEQLANIVAAVVRALLHPRGVPLTWTRVTA